MQELIKTNVHCPLEFQQYKSATRRCLIVAIGLGHKITLPFKIFDNK